MIESTVCLTLVDAYARGITRMVYLLVSAYLW
jgi:hypothetical protein